MLKIEIIFSVKGEQIKEKVIQGYCPVECSIDGESIVDDLKMDHHGEL